MADMAAAQEPRVQSANSKVEAMDLDQSQEQPSSSSEQNEAAPEAGPSGRPQATGGSLEECLALLRGKSDEQRLVGLLLATKFVSSGDMAAVEAVFDAVGWAFIGRLFKTGEASGGALSPYATLALSLLSAFVRVPKLAAATEMIERVPLLLRVVKSGSEEAGPVQDALECLLGIAGASEEGLTVELESGGVEAVCHSLARGEGDEDQFPLAIRLLGTLLNAAPKVPGSLEGGELAIPTLAQGFAGRTDMLVFECLGCLLGLLRDPEVRAKAPRCGDWSENVRVGVGNLLQSRNVKAEHRLGALKLVHLMVEESGEDWLVGISQEVTKQGRDNFFLVLMNTIRVEIAVQLNEVARALFGSKEGKEKGAFTPALEEALSSCLALLEAGVNVLAEVASADITAVKRTKEEALPATKLSADTAQKAFGAASEATAVVLDFLEQAKEHELHSDDTVLASVRVVGRFLTEVPEAHRDKLAPLLGFLLKIRGSDKSAQRLDLSGVWCLLPALGQITEEAKGCKMVLKEEGHKAITEFGIDAIEFSLQHHDADSMELEEAGTSRVDSSEAPVARALDVLLNILDQQAAGAVQISFSDFQTLLPALQSWTRGKPGSPLRLALSAAVISNVLVLTDERALSDQCSDVRNLLEPVVRFLDESFMSQRNSGAVFDRELWELSLAAGAELLEKYPSFRESVGPSTWMQEVRTMSGGRLSCSTIEHFADHGALLNFLAAAAEIEEQGR